MVACGRVNGGVWPRDGCRPNRGGWHGGDEPQSRRAPFFLVEGDS